ncbi:DNA primase [Acidisarcina polymorpha]|uniref:DNA primase n=2 Tax=Acidisarcina polymorpha TaxID=2211140 RepID=A0A2Z5G1V8_9BACT|nr:DNA primase [Acidisarcina polymorpha]AXC13069.1 DNA primase [Acidisarcina polymorpha]
MANDFAQTVKQQADIVKIIGDYVRLKKSGAQNFQGLCPFHSEKSPSFSVHATRQFYHCFGCGQSGDVFSFLQKIENLSFPEAVRAVAQKCGIPLPKRDFNSPEEAQESRQRGKLLDLHEAATVWFQEQLRSPEGAGAREYLTGRGVTPEAIAKFRIGFAPDSYTALRDRLASGVDAESLRASGLFSWKEQEDGSPGPLYSRFRKRITFPIMNESGRVIAFTARALDSATAGNEKAGPKYLNSPETPLYSKGQVLFNLDKARAAIRQLNFALLVEGQMDCISVYMTGVQNVLATSGTAFTEYQVNLLKRHCTQVAVNFDPDTAGANAAEKSIALLTEEGFTVKVITLEDGLDPDRYVRERGAAAYHTAARTAQALPDYLIERARQLFPSRSPEAKVKALNYLLPHIRRMPNLLARDEFAANAAQKLSIDSAVLREELRQAAAKRRDAISSNSVGFNECERVLIRAFAALPDDPAYMAAAAALDREPHIFEELSVASLLEALRNRGSGDPVEALTEGRDRQMVAQVLFAESEPVTLDQVTAALQPLHHHYLSRRQRGLRASLAEAERKGDWAQVAALSNEKIQLDRQLREIGH